MSKIEGYINKSSLITTEKIIKLNNKAIIRQTIYACDELSIPWISSHLLQTRDWEDRDGNKRYTTEIMAWRMQMLDRAGKTAEVEYPEKHSPTEEPVEADGPEDDIPF